jgi:membrane-bound lytic murein transglycosylase D
LNTYWQSQTMLVHKRANRWFPVISPILKKNGIPDDFKFLALAESAFLNNSSPAGAAGYWQFLEATAKSYGLEINDDVDERYNVEKSTEAACKYFKEAFASLGSWSLVAASYNMGISGVKRQVEKQRVKTYFDLLLNDETSRYIFRILALKEIVSKPVLYGYHFRKSDLYAPFPYTSVIVDSSITNLVDFAESQKINYKILKALNPWLRQNGLSNKLHKPYIIKILKPGYTGIELGEDNQLVDTASTMAKMSSAKIEQEKPIGPPETLKTKKTVRKLAKGETLMSLSREYNVTVEQLKNWNNIQDASSVKKGQKIIIMVPEEE